MISLYLDFAYHQRLLACSFCQTIPKKKKNCVILSPNNIMQHLSERSAVYFVAIIELVRTLREITLKRQKGRRRQAF